MFLIYRYTIKHFQEFVCRLFARDLIKVLPTKINLYFFQRKFFSMYSKEIQILSLPLPLPRKSKKNQSLPAYSGGEALGQLRFSHWDTEPHFPTFWSCKRRQAHRRWVHQHGSTWTKRYIESLLDKHRYNIVFERLPKPYILNTKAGPHCMA